MSGSRLAPLALVVSWNLLPSLAAAQSADARAPEELVVTASRNPVSAHTVGSSLSVIDAEDLEDGQFTLIADALRETPGLAVSRGGGFGAVTQVRMRGAEGNHTLVLIDGVEANNPVSNSEFDFANLLVADVERVEILRGPQSALYGSDAIGGVINVITRHDDETARAALHAEGGTFGTNEIGVSLGGGTARYSGGFSVTRLATDGFNISRFGNESDGYRNSTLSAHGRAELSERMRLETTLRYIDSKQDSDSQDFSFPPSPTQGLVVDDAVAGALRQWFFRFQATAGELGSTWRHRFGLSLTDTENRYFDAGTPNGSNAGRKIKLDYQATVPLGDDQSITFGAERETVDYKNRGASASAAENQSQDDAQTSLVAEYRARLGRADFSASTRYDHNRRFDDATTYRLAASIALPEHARLHASLGTGIADPGFFELFGFFPDSFVGNPALQPERSTSFDLGLELAAANSRLHADLTYFHADLREEIQTVFDPVSFVATTVNLPGTSRRNGVELTFDARLASAWRLRASYTYTDAEQSDGRAELRRPKRIGSLEGGVDLAGGRGHVEIAFDFNGRQQDAEFIDATPADRVTLPAYTLVRVAGEYRLAPRWRLYGRVENLLDESYEEWFSYRSPGRTFTAGFRLDLL